MYARVFLLLVAALLLTAAPASAEPQGDAFVTVVDAPDPVEAGAEITYTITVGSNEPGPATGVELEGTVPVGTTPVAAVTSSPAAECDDVNTATTAFKCELGTIPEGERVTVVLVVDTSATTPTPVTTVVTIKAKGDSVKRNNTATATTAVQPSPGTSSPPPAADLALTNSDSPDPVTAGGTLTYTLKVTNVGPDGATDVALVDDLPASTTLVSASSTQGFCRGSGLVSCVLGTVPKGAAVTVIIVVVPTKPGTILNSAFVFTDDSFDPKTANNSAASTTTVTSKPPAPPPPVAPPPAPPPPGITIGAAPTLAPDVVPPGKVEAVRATVGNRSVVVRWRAPSDPDFQRVELTRSSARARARVVYSGRGEAFADRGVRNGVRYVYELRTFDRAGNASDGVRFAATPKALLLFSPPPNARVSTAPLLRWVAVRGSGFYNVQVYRGSRKVLSGWPRSNRLRLRARWIFRGRVERLAPGTYHWFVWPSRGLRSRPRYGPLLGRSSFVVVRRLTARP